MSPLTCEVVYLAGIHELNDLLAMRIRIFSQCDLTSGSDQCLCGLGVIQHTSIPLTQKLRETGEACTTIPEMCIPCLHALDVCRPVTLFYGCTRKCSMMLSLAQHEGMHLLSRVELKIQMSTWCEGGASLQAWPRLRSCRQRASSKNCLGMLKEWPARSPCLR